MDELHQNVFGVQGLRQKIWSFLGLDKIRENGTFRRCYFCDYRLFPRHTVVLHLEQIRHLEKNIGQKVPDYHALSIVTKKDIKELKLRETKRNILFVLPFTKNPYFYHVRNGYLRRGRFFYIHTICLECIELRSAVSVIHDYNDERLRSNPQSKRQKLSELWPHLAAALGEEHN